MKEFAISLHRLVVFRFPLGASLTDVVAENASLLSMKPHAIMIYFPVRMLKVDRFCVFVTGLGQESFYFAKEMQFTQIMIGDK